GRRAWPVRSARSCFFYSSRRRHTRCLSDWSSDVCSSDLAFTVAGVAAVAGWIAPGFDWRIGFVLGAVVSPTDAIAATSIARNMGLPRRIVDVLEGESLVNDATGLLAVEMGVLLLTWGEIPPASFVLFRLSYLVACGLGVGLLLGLVVDWF